MDFRALYSAALRMLVQDCTLRKDYILVGRIDFIKWDTANYI